MKPVKLTPDQEKAVTHRGGPLLVSAAAGSGKTKVLVERLLGRVEAEGVGVDRFLIITYTNAAASELRGKILSALYERIALDPENSRLRREIARCSRAKIGTIHSFCVSVIRENAHLLGINPGFRVAEEAESATIRQDVLAEVVEARYASGDPGFLALADTLGAGRDDSGLLQIVLSAHTSLLSHPDPTAWVARQEAAMEAGEGTDLGETPWGRLLLDKVKRWTAYTVRRIDSLLEEPETFLNAYAPSLETSRAALLSLGKACDQGWEEARRWVDLPFPRAKPLKGYEEQKAVRKRIMNEAKKLPDLLGDSSQEALADIRRTHPLIHSLFALVLDFEAAYQAEKRRRGVLDFSDQEHLALRLLRDPQTGEPTATAKGVAEHFVEIMVDEYQDVNEIQESIFTAVSRQGQNLFMVGDVKQSIYRFRLADPRIFLRKYNAFRDNVEAGSGEGRRVILSQNFRSRKGILEAANFVFRNVMSVECGEMDYTDREALVPGAPYGDPTEPEVELVLLDGANAEEEDPDKTESEAAYAAQRVRELVGRMTVTEGESARPLTYGDVAILMAAPRGRAALWKKVFEEQGIPLAFGDEGAFFDAPEISIAMSLAAVTDNPRQDIPLLTVLRSPIYGFTSEELATMREEDSEGDLYAALVKAAEKDGKCRRALEELQRFREEARDMTADGFLWHLFTETGLFAAVSAMPGGEKRYRNLMTLLDCAHSFESLGYKGLYGFNSYLNRLMREGKSPVTGGDAGSGNAVRLMSIHKSKGLEFPVVILADLTKQFNNENIRKPLLLHADLGVGPKAVDLAKRITYPTVARRAVQEAITREGLAEQMRVLYVAMTRPREKLILLCAYADGEKKLKNLQNAPLPVPPSMVEGVENLAGLLLLPALRRPECAPLRFGNPTVPCDTEGAPWVVRHIHTEELEDLAYEREDRERLEAPDPQAVAALAQRLAWRYPREKAAAMPSKVTATELKGAFRDQETHEDADELLRPVRPLRPPKRPDFAGQPHRLTAAEKGVATHLVMQYADYDLCRTVRGVQTEIRRLRLIGNLTPEEAEAIDPAVIARFFASPVGQEVMSAKRLWRELKFSLLVPSQELPGFAPGEEILLQGVVDCCLENEEGLTVLDYKTDRVTPETLAQRAESYRGQLDAYAVALERILKKPVLRRVLYFLTPGLSYSL